MQGHRRRIIRILNTLCLLFGLGLIFAPLVFVHLFSLDYPELSSQRGAEAAIGVAVILRATLRRLLRAGSTNLLRTSIGAFSRTSARTMTRRVARTGSRLVLGMIARRPPDGDASAPSARSGDGAADQSWFVSVVATFAGFAALALSFYFVAMRDSRDPQGDASATIASGTIALSELSLLAALPLLFYAGSAVLTARCFGATARIRTAIDGLLLQGYFAGAGSFLPMTTDIEYLADDRRRSRIAFCVLLGLFAAHLLLHAVGAALGSARLEMLSTFMLVYSFVYSFPIPPLEGYWIWKGSRTGWAVLWLPILASFLLGMPDSILRIL